MYPHFIYNQRSGPAGFPFRSPFLFGAPFLGGLIGGFLGGAIFNYPRPYFYPPVPYGPVPYGGGYPGPYGGGGYPGPYPGQGPQQY